MEKSNFNDILTNLKRKFEITDSKWCENRRYEIKFRTSIRIEHEDYNKFCDEWMEAFSHVTDTVWVHTISNTGPRVKFRKQYQCWPYRSKEVDTNLLFNHSKCRATMDVKVLGNGKWELGRKKTNRYMKLGLNALVKMNFHHLHDVDTTKNYAFFIHWCNPVAESPAKPPSSPTDVQEKIAKIVGKAPPTPNPLKFVEASPSPMAVPQQPEENVIYIHQMVFDSATQTLKEITSSVNSEFSTYTNHEYLPVQVEPEASHIVNMQPVNTNFHNQLSNF